MPDDPRAQPASGPDAAHDRDSALIAEFRGVAPLDPGDENPIDTHRRHYRESRGMK